MKTFSAKFILLLLATTCGFAQADDLAPSQKLAELIYGSFEERPDAGVDIGEFVHFGQDVFVSMDFDDSGSIDLAEFIKWDFGFNFIATDTGQERAYETAQIIIFATWDHDGDGNIAKSEYNKSMVWDFRRADTNDDALLTREEFLQSYVVNIAYRAALTGQ